MKMSIRPKTSSDGSERLILLTGASGYVGSRLLRALEAEGHRVRCAGRRPEAIASRAQKTTVVRADVLDRESIDAAMRGVDTAYYLVHSMNSERSFESADREGARNFAEAARAAGVRRIIYLGGLGSSSRSLSPHLRSRHEVGELLRASSTQVIEFRASAIIGGGSLSFEMVRALAERLLLMIMPRWVTMQAQPISINDAIRYLVAALDLSTTASCVFEIGGAERVSYAGIIREYAQQRGLKRAMIRVPVLTPRLSSWWLKLVTPLQARVGRELVESVRHATVVSNDLALRMFSIRPAGIQKAVADALRDEDFEFSATRWSHALSAAPSNSPWGGVRIGNRLIV
ncbi:MAG: NAD(P)H-binding protein [Candidatus Binatus sp.]